MTRNKKKKKYIKKKKITDGRKILYKVYSGSPIHLEHCSISLDYVSVLVSYCKTECPTPQWKQLPNGEMGNRFTAEDIPRLSEYSASLYATTIPQLQSYQQYYETYFRAQLAQVSF